MPSDYIFRPPPRGASLDSKHRTPAFLEERAKTPTEQSLKGALERGVLMKHSAREPHRFSRAVPLVASALHLLRTRTQSRGGLAVLERYNQGALGRLTKTL
jgi:hypothetical protein